MFNLKFSVFTTFLFIFFAVALFLLFRVADNYLPVFFRKQKLRKFFERYFALFEFIVWIIFSVFTFYKFLNSNQYFALVLFILLTIFAIWSARILFADYIAGLIFKTNQNIAVGDEIEINDISGNVIEMKFRSIVLETYEMEVVYIPYSQIFNKAIKKKRAKDNISGYTFELTVPKKMPVNDIIKRIHEIILCSPWVSLKKDSIIELLRETNSVYTFEITAYISNNEYLSEIRSLLVEDLS